MSPTPRVFRDEPLLEVVAFVRRAVAARAPIELVVLDPDHGRGRYAGELVDGHVHRPWRVWVELADRLGLRMRTPRPRADGPVPLVQLAFEPLDRDATMPRAYGADSTFARIDKREDPGFVLDLADALDRARLPEAPRILELGVNAGGILALVVALAPALAKAAAFVGIDHSASALAAARVRLADVRDLALVDADLNRLDEAVPPLGRFDLVLAIGVLQSAGIDDRVLLRRVVQDHLAPAGAIILGVPNCRYVDGELAHGARMRNFAQPELGLVVKDIAFYRKYLQQHGRKVYVTGDHYLLVTGATG
jgi:SAM-dependent methyltransferase